MGVTTTKTNKPLNPRGNDQSPLAFNRAKLYSGKALDFDGVNDEVNCGDVSDLDFGTGNFSFSLYVKINSAQSSLENIFSKKDQAASTAGYSIFYNHSTGKLLFSNANGTSASEIFSADSFTQYEDQWIHLVAVRDSSDDKNAYFYINAVKHELASPLTIYDTDNSYDFKIGNTHTGAYFNNQQVAGLKAFNVALTAAQVADLYNNPEKVVPTGVNNTALKLWLPMMEGAGTTAYDGSGNGNHGTISGATYVNGVGAPVAQSAVISWNKGTNLLTYSEQFDESSYWSPLQSTIIANDTTAPDGQTTADKILASATTGNHQVDGTFFSIVSGAVTSSIYAKKGNTDFVRLRHNSTTQQIRAWFDLENGVVGSVDAGGSATIEDVGNGWYRCTMTESGNTKTGLASLQIFINESDNQTTWTADGDEYIYLWGASFEQASTAGPYIPTLSTAQTTPVLLPQGLTSGRDITGVNLFENVRKQGALNLDGNSWAEVHDNESLDFGTGSFSLEAWAKFSYVSQGSSLNAILTLGGDTGQLNQGRAALVSLLGSKMSFYYNASSHSSTSTFSDGDWVHFVGVYDETNAIVYINGAEESTTARTASSITNTDVKMIGRDSIATRYYHDQIAQPRIYNRALTAEEVLRNYNSGKNTYK